MDKTDRPWHSHLINHIEYRGFWIRRDENIHTYKATFVVLAPEGAPASETPNIEFDSLDAAQAYIRKLS